MSKLRRRKLVVVSFHKGTKHPFVANFEEVFLYGMLTKLSIHTDVLVRDLATGVDRFNLAPQLTLAQTLQELHKLCERNAARYVLTGSMHPSFDADGKLTDIKIAARLYDGV